MANFECDHGWKNGKAPYKNQRPDLQEIREMRLYKCPHCGQWFSFLE